MDKVRLGRVFGKATRLAARTALEAVDAATAPDPRGNAGTEARRPAVDNVPRVPEQPVVERPLRAERGPGLKMIPGSRAATAAATQAFGRSTLSPLKQASQALWFEVTGSFFALFAFSFGVAAWHFRGLVGSADGADHWRFGSVCGLAILFAWFSGSSFLRARRRT